MHRTALHVPSVSPSPSHPLVSAACVKLSRRSLYSTPASTRITHHHPNSISCRVDVRTSTRTASPASCNPACTPAFYGQRFRLRTYLCPLLLAVVIIFAHLKALNGEPVQTEAGCCAACSAAGVDRCETWQFCQKGKGCAGATGVPLTGGCYIGKMGNCKKSANGWVSRARGTGPPPPSPPPPPPSPAPPPPKRFTVTDVWKQAAVNGSHSGWSDNALAPHDSIFLTVMPAV